MFRAIACFSTFAALAFANSAETCSSALTDEASIECVGRELAQRRIGGNSLLQTSTVHAQAEPLEDSDQIEDVLLAQVGEESTSSRRRRRRSSTRRRRRSSFKSKAKASSGLSCAASAYENADFTHGQAGTCTGCLIPKNHGQGVPLCFYRNDKYAEVACSASEGKVWCGNHVPVTQPPAPATTKEASTTTSALMTATPSTAAATTTTRTTTTSTTTTTTTTTTQNLYECVAPPGKNFHIAKEICPKQNEYWCKIKGPSCEWKLRSQQFEGSGVKENGACSSEKGTAWSNYCSKSESKSQCEGRYAGNGKCIWTPSSDPATSKAAGADAADAASSCEDDASFKNNWGWSCAKIASASWAKSVRKAKCNIGWGKSFAEPCKKTCNRC